MRPVLSLATGLRRETSGAAMVETGMSMLICFMVVLFIAQICMLVFSYGVYAEAARVGVRYGVQHGSDNALCSGPFTTPCSDASGTNVTAAVNNFASRFMNLIAGATVTPSWPDSSCAPNSRMVVTVQFTYVPFTGLSGFRVSHTIVAQGRITY